MRTFLEFLRVVSRQAGAPLITLAGYSYITGHPIITVHHLDKILQFIVFLIGSAVILNILHRHFNELLERLVREREHSDIESRRTLSLLKKLFRIKEKPQDTPAPPSSFDVEVTRAEPHDQDDTAPKL